MTQLPADVTIPQLPAATTLGGTELFEAVQTAAGVGNSVKVSASLIASFVATSVIPLLPPQTANTVLAGPTSGGAAVPAFRALANADLPAQSGLSVFGVVGTAAAIGTAIPGTTDQVLRIAQNGTTLGFGAINLATSAAVTGVLQAVNMTAVNLASANVAGGVQGILPVPNGGTNTASFTAWGAVYANNTTSLKATAAATAAYALLSNGTTSAPSFQQVNLTTSVTGVLGVPFGGTNTSTLTAFGVVYGNGTSTVGITSAGAEGKLLIGQSTTLAPSFQTVSLDVTMSSAGTATVVGLQGRAMLSTAPTTSQVVQWNGAAWAPATTGAGTVTNITTAFGLTGGAITTSGTISISTTAPPYGLEIPINCGMTASVAGNALTITLTDQSGAAPTATSPILFPFRSATAAIGLPNWRSASATLALTVTQSATLGAFNNVPSRFWVTAHDTGTSPIVGLINCVSTGTIFPLMQNTTQTTIAISSTALSAGVYYASAAVSGKPFLIVGYLEFSPALATAGQYTTAPTGMQLFGPGTRLPGTLVQLVQALTSTTFSTLSTSYLSSTLTASITPTNACNAVDVNYNATGDSGVTNLVLTMALHRGNTQVGPVQTLTDTGSVVLSPQAAAFVDFPGTAAATTYVVKIKGSTSGSSCIYPLCNEGEVAYMALRELAV